MKMLTKSPLLCWHTRPLFVGTCDVAMPRLLCAVDPEGRSLLTRTYGNVATPSFPTVALLASVAAYVYLLCVLLCCVRHRLHTSMS